MDPSEAKRREPIGFPPRTETRPHLPERPDAHVTDLWERARPHMLAEAELVGIYER